MKNLIITTLLTLIGYQSYSQGLFMVGAGTASSPSPNAAAPINTIGITNNGNFTQNNSSTFNGTINATQDLKVGTNADITQDLKVGGKAEITGDLKVTGKTEFLNDNCFKGDKTFVYFLVDSCSFNNVGIARRIGSQYCFINTRGFSLTSSSLRIQFYMKQSFAHELGHCLNLRHAVYGTFQNFTSCCSVDASS